jgi:hypothetical protein
MGRVGPPGGPGTGDLSSAPARNRAVHARIPQIGVGFMAVAPVAQDGSQLVGPSEPARGAVADLDLERAADAASGRARTVPLAYPCSFCAGVERAVKVVETALASVGAPVHGHRQIVHHSCVVDQLERQGAAFASAPAVLVEEAVAAIGEQGPATVSDRAVTAETVHFALPGKVHTP